ncbi:MAG: hypothetical protein IR158_05430 [Cellulomonas sp.]|uniref:hypothetical protein n=1 Tax=Cellulomonas sp. TaxID=40001 RepID=UPI001A02A8C7|nr:hypothetical protein [Cellulomonas sp.]MBF0687197.1 hypothetical protein [Cellulomonas sp.]
MTRDATRSTRLTARALVLAMLVGVGVLVTPLLPGPATAPAAEAADLSRFDPGLIISDSVFYDSGTMSAAQVQAFLDQRGADCRPAAGSTCLKSYRESTTTRPATDRCAGTYSGAASESAATIIAKVAVACGINPQVLLVTLQKEQGLVTASTGRSAAVYRKAMGFGCPDTAACDTQYYGFFNQVYSAASQFKQYALHPTRYGHIAGRTNAVRFHPNAACGSSQVHIQNQATAGLYNYTPYQPNAAALAAGYGTGDACSSYGNRNFWNYFADWFGSSTARQPIGVIDAVSSDAPGTISVRGWAFDPDTSAPISVHVYVDGKAVRAATANGARPDVQRVYRRTTATAGFSTTVDAADGRHRVCVYAIDGTGDGNPMLGCADVTVRNSAPVGVLDSAVSTEGRLAVRGWAFDPDTSASIAVHVYVDGKAVRSVTANTSRPDVARVYGRGAAHGYSTTVPASPGARQVCVYAIDSTGGANPRIGCTTTTVVNRSPVGALDVARSGTGEVTLGGWAFDPDTDGSITVRVTTDGKQPVSLVAGASRPDVARVHGRGAAHGFNVVVPATPGPHEFCVEALDSWDGPATRIACRTVDVNGVAFGRLDTATAGSGTVTATGWAIDPNTTEPISVHLYVDGTAVRAVTANLARPDVDRAHGMGAAHGFSVQLTALPGTRSVCAYAIDSWGGGPNPLLGCRSVTVP